MDELMDSHISSQVTTKEPIKRHFIVYYTFTFSGGFGHGNIGADCESYPSLKGLKKAIKEQSKEIVDSVITGITELSEQDYNDYKA